MANIRAHNISAPGAGSKGPNPPHSGPTPRVRHEVLQPSRPVHANIRRVPAAGCTPHRLPEVPMFESCCSPHESAHLLHSRFGLPVEMFAARLYLTSGDQVEAIEIPAGMGAQVRDRLAELPATPAVADPRDRRWAFLVAAPTPYHGVPVRMRSLLTAYGVTFPARGSRVMLPSSDHPADWHWVSEPKPGHLVIPHRAVVLQAIRKVILEGPDSVSA